ncbi:MAG: hypothetical protein RR531_05730 [Longicatena sp.]
MKRSYANLMLIFVTIVWGGGFIATSGALDTFFSFLYHDDSFCWRSNHLIVT